MNIKAKTVPILIIIANLYFLPATIYNIYSHGGPHGVGYYFLPATVIPNLFIISALLSFKKRHQNKLSTINNVGIIIIAFIIVAATLIINFS